MSVYETKKELTTKINHLVQVSCGLFGIIIAQYISFNGMYILAGYVIGSLIGMAFYPYNKQGELRY